MSVVTCMSCGRRELVDLAPIAQRLRRPEAVRISEVINRLVCKTVGCGGRADAEYKLQERLTAGTEVSVAENLGAPSPRGVKVFTTDDISPEGLRLLEAQIGAWLKQSQRTVLFSESAVAPMESELRTRHPEWTDHQLAATEKSLREKTHGSGCSPAGIYARYVISVWYC